MDGWRGEVEEVVVIKDSKVVDSKEMDEAKKERRGF